MIRRWMIVVEWKEGIATLFYKKSNNTCNTYCLTNNDIIKTCKNYIIKVKISVPLEPGQVIEVGVHDHILLYSAILVYIIPLFSIFLFSIIFEILFHINFASVYGAILGVIISFYITQRIALFLEKHKKINLLILSKK
ncbi:SoxR reducing system RseC family protein [Pantoea sp. Aalb]|uniref:SoxR reducing system RseC family protein n=1 Tax=Pantoea sp. Aalb TaxID=2576762 RepID=UPI00135BEF06|nr:SoxR reducing system RseC family protein [Pantoea sp. Aalb]